MMGQFDGHIDDFFKLTQWTTFLYIFPHVKFSGGSENQLKNAKFSS